LRDAWRPKATDLLFPALLNNQSPLSRFKDQEEKPQNTFGWKEANIVQEGDRQIVSFVVYGVGIR
jgi:hypothetical protein